MPELTVIICTHNPHGGRLTRTLDGMKSQSLPQHNWELLLIDNASSDRLEARIDLSWHSNVRIVREERLGLTHARLRAITEARSENLVWVDDDNILCEDYLKRAQAIFTDHERIGVFGGKTLPEFETAPPAWFEAVHGPLGLQDHGNKSQQMSSKSWRSGYPRYAPCGAGMCMRRSVVQQWASDVENSPLRKSLGRVGKSLSSGEDNDIVLTAMKSDWDVGYFPQLCLTHLIPSSRLTAEYHSRLIEQSNRSWVLTLGVHGISPWPPIRPQTAWLRKLRAALRMRPWEDIPSHLRWKGACGKLEGQADLWRLRLPGIERK